MDLKVAEVRKHYDLVHSKYLKRHGYFNKLVDEYRELLLYKDSAQQNEDLSGPPPETLEEDANRKVQFVFI